MPELCDRCDFEKSDGNCRVCSKKEQQNYIDRKICNFAAVRGRSVSMTPKDYLFARRWYRKGESVKT